MSDKSEHSNIEKMQCSYCKAETHTETNCRSKWDGVGNRIKLHCEYCGQWNNHMTCCCPKTVNGRLNREDPDHHDHYVSD